MTSNSQQLYDTWSCVHFGSGVVSSAVFKLPLVVGISTHQIWEIVENSPIMVDLGKWITEVSPKMSHLMEWDTYHGDSKRNSASDTIFFTWGAVLGAMC